MEPRTLKHLLKTWAILEVGAGKSVVAEAVKASHSNVKLTLLDSSKEMLAISKGWAEFAEFVVADARSKRDRKSVVDIFRQKGVNGA